VDDFRATKSEADDDDFISMAGLVYKLYSVVMHIQKSQNKNTTRLQRQQLIRGLDIMGY